MNPTEDEQVIEVEAISDALELALSLPEGLDLRDRATLEELSREPETPPADRAAIDGGWSRNPGRGGSDFGVNQRMEVGMTPEPELGPDDKVGFLIFRETFLALLDDRGALVCRQFGEVVGERFLDSSEAAENRVPFTVAEFYGATRDLAFLAAFLERMGAEPAMSDLTRTEKELAKVAAGAARGLRDIAARMRRALDRATRDEEG